MGRFSFVSGGGSSGTADLPESTPGALLVGDNLGGWAATDAGDVKADTAEFSGDVSAVNVDAEAVDVVDSGLTQAVSITPTGITCSDSGTGGTVAVGPDSVTIGAAELTAGAVNACAGTSGTPGAANPFVTSVDPRFTGLDPGGRLHVPPAYMQTSGEAGFALTSASHGIAVLVCPEGDMDLTSVSIRIAAVTTPGNLNLKLYSSAAGFEASGTWNSRPDNVAPQMTANNAPSPYVVAIKDKNNANAEAVGYEAYKAWDRTIYSNSLGARSNATPSGTDPIYFTIDLGAGNAKAINKDVFFSADSADAGLARCTPKDWTRWGSNSASPDPTNDADWTQLGTWSNQSDPGRAYAAVYRFTNGTAYRHHRWKITDRNGTGTFVCIGEIRMYEAGVSQNPAALVQDLGAVASGSGAGTVRHTFSAVNLVRGQPYWVIVWGSNGASYQVGKARVKTTTGSGHPSNTRTKETSDAGVSWTQSLESSKPAMANIVLNSNANHSPVLHYGAHRNAHIELYDGAAWQDHLLPSAGITLDCDALTAMTVYNVFLYNNSGTLTLEASTTGVATQNGVLVKSGAATRRLVGQIAPVAWSAGHAGPVDAYDMRLVINEFNRLPKLAGRKNPYISLTDVTQPGTDWHGFDGAAWSFYLLGRRLEWLPAFFISGAPSAGGWGSVASGDDDTDIHAQYIYAYSASHCVPVKVQHGLNLISAMGNSTAATTWRVHHNTNKSLADVFMAVEV